jgi:hypothetical protein
MSEVFAIRCFRGKSRKLTHQLTKKEARVFRTAALHLVGYLTKAYKLGRATK